MGKKNYSITLDEEVVDEVKDNLSSAEKLSPFLNQLLIDWNKKRKKQEEDFD